MTESIYKEYENKYYNPNDNDKRPGDNDNWKSIQKGFHDIGSTQLETSAGLTLGKGTEDETSLTAAELEAMKQSGGNILPMIITGLLLPAFSVDGNSSVDVSFNFTESRMTALRDLIKRINKQCSLDLLFPYKGANGAILDKVVITIGLTDGRQTTSLISPSSVDRYTDIYMSIHNKTSETVSQTGTWGSVLLVLHFYDDSEV